MRSFGYKKLAITVIGYVLCSVITVYADTCSDATGEFAHCKKEYRNFKSVVLAIHGWNGSCNSTFGEGEHSIYNILGPNSHYDFDCLDYDSKQTELGENIEKFKKHLLFLKQLGYENVMLVTHSTGGVIALSILTDLVLDKEGNLLDNGPSLLGGLRIVSVQAWATPINGVRSQISIGGSLLDVIGFSPETIPDLSPDSQFLANLKARLAKIRDFRDHGNDSWVRSVTNIPVVFLHGEGEDWVVRPISSTDRESEWWWKNSWGFVMTDTGHSHNIAESGEVGEPTFPGYVLDTATLLNVPLAPRYDEIFPDNSSEALIPRQLKVVEGMINYGKLQFDKAFGEYKEFLGRMFAQDCSRNSQVDMKLVGGLLELVQDQFSPPSKDVAFCFVQSVPNTLENYDPSGGENECKLGRNRPSVALSILQMLEFIYKNIIDYVADHPLDEDYIFSGDFSSIVDFETKMFNLIARFFESEYERVYSSALVRTNMNIERASVQALMRSKIIFKVDKLYSAKIGTLSPRTQKSAERVFVSLVNKDEKTRSKTLQVLNKKVDGKVLWTSFSNDKPVKEILSAVKLANKSDKESFEFALNVASKAGVKGNNPSLAKDAKEVAFKVVERSDNSADKKAWLKKSTEMHFKDMSIKSDFERKYKMIKVENPVIMLHQPPVMMIDQPNR